MCEGKWFGVDRETVYSFSRLLLYGCIACRVAFVAVYLWLAPEVSGPLHAMDLSWCGLLLTLVHTKGRYLSQCCGLPLELVYIEGPLHPVDFPQYCDLPQNTEYTNNPITFWPTSPWLNNNLRGMYIYKRTQIYTYTKYRARVEGTLLCCSLLDLSMEGSAEQSQLFLGEAHACCLHLLWTLSVQGLNQAHQLQLKV